MEVIPGISETLSNLNHQVFGDLKSQKITSNPFEHLIVRILAKPYI